MAQSGAIGSDNGDLTKQFYGNVGRHFIVRIEKGLANNKESFNRIRRRAQPIPGTLGPF